MKEFFSRLNPTERRFVVGVGVLFFLVANLVWVWPHFGDWGETKTRMKNASDKLAQFQQGTNRIPALQKEIEKFQKQGQVVPSNDQAVQFVRLIQNQASRSGVIIVSMTPQRQATGPGQDNPFFVEQNQTLTLQSQEKQLVDFLYNLGAGDSLIRVRSLSVQPDQTHQQLTTRATLVASYQKKPTAAAPAHAPAAAPAATSKPATAPKPQPATPANRPVTTPPGIAPGRPLPHVPGAPGTAPRNNLTPNKK